MESGGYCVILCAGRVYTFRGKIVELPVFFKDCELCSAKCCDFVLRSVCGDCASRYQKVTIC